MTAPDASPPLIVTLALDPSAQAWFDELRRAHFPPDRNLVPAHVTLFHALPGSRRDDVERGLEHAAGRGPVQVDVTGLRFLGRGVAYRLRSAALAGLREALAGAFEPWLTRQDRARYDPHVTVQNRVPPQVARALMARLEDGFRPTTVRGTGLDLWSYLGGPWAHRARFPFRAGDGAP